jgi:hypothetical protein
MTRTQYMIGGWLILLVLVAGLIYYFWPTSQPAVEGVTSGFTPTSTLDSGGLSATLQTAIDQGASAFGVMVTPLSIEEDSRCPLDVQCIQAGTVRVKVLVTQNGTSTTQVFTLTTPIDVNGTTIELIAADPAKYSTVITTPQDYRFTFRITPTAGAAGKG